MRIPALALFLLALPSGSVTAQPAQPSFARPVSATEISYALNDWRRLRASDGYAFSDYARFLNAFPDWPDETRMRRAAERQLRAGDYGPSIVTFFRTDKPRTANGWARYAEALAAAGRQSEAATAAREAWASPDLSLADEGAVRARFWSALSPADHDRRVDALLFDKKPDTAASALAYASPARRAAFQARIAMQKSAPDSDSLYRMVEGQLSQDAGLLMDRLRFLNDTYRNSAGARALAARPHRFVHRPADIDRWYDMLLILARDAYNAGAWSQAYAIASQVDDAYAPGTDVSDLAYAVRDNYTSLTWLAGQAALTGTRNYPAAASAFVKYAHGGRSLQVTSKGYYWAGRAMSYAARGAEANAYFAQAARYPELFYGQLALERLGRPVPAPANLPTMLVTPAQRAAFAGNRLARAVELLAQQNRRDEATLFVRALSESLTTDSDRILAVELGQRLRRPDVAVWVARSARNDGSPFYYRPAFPTHASSVPPGRLWSLVHGITRQESSFDRSVVSHAGARGLMQLMPGTASDEARKAGVGYDFSRLTTDPAYNVMLGSNHAQRLVSRYDGNYVLAVAAYNAGGGNVNKWVARFGDPRRGNVDILRWIEQIPFMETRGYVQRVLENSVVYDRLNAPSQSASLSQFLGKSRPG
ncbi:lytic transglycosylase domain-containing protein [Sphingomonas mesophila]|uniref:lytic transglycosylase domain-containing protein n=1 Tax=Sphingomonas mesophila TaxID=2303576 RepID=UPI0013C2FC75|nr:lytic transglycosylase domain-containing protein [Sphingomonas mesophila]